MEHPLPPRPSFIPSDPAAGPSRLPLLADRSNSGTLGNSAGTINGRPAQSTTLSTTQCVVCSETPKYTCPRCSARTCSLTCSKTHKSRDGCSGVRDPTAYVSLKEYGQGAWSDDYAWLEQGRRKVGEWGSGVKVEELPAGPPRRGDTRNKRGGRKGGKMDGLRKELEKLGCTVEFMPEGMARRKTNQSSWNPKSQQLHMTIHLTAPESLLDPTMTTFAQRIIPHQRVLVATKDSDKATLPTLTSLLPTPIEAAHVFALPFHSTSSRPAPEHLPDQRLFYPPLEPGLPLAQVLRGTAWVEFPMIEVVSRQAWDQGLSKGTIGIIPLSEGTTPIGSRERDAGWGKRKASGEGHCEQVAEVAKKVRIVEKPADGLLALGDYASEEEESDEEDGDERDMQDHDDGEEVDVEDAEGALDAVDDLPEPSMAVLQAVGMALAADLGEA
ncbi:hypothetical protein IAU60_002777 [Kwoniella sp. DSM 27419]